jgi:hypothetical protein
MKKRNNNVIFFICLFGILGILNTGYSQVTFQNTQIRGFIETNASVQKGKLSFGFGEQDLFITSEISDRLSFLGETVFKFTGVQPTTFSVSVERVIMKYNIAGNHNFLIGKHHTPINYWNDTYHHGRVFFPTIYRPLLFDANIIPLHTNGISLQGHNLGDLKFGYDLMLGNGIGSSDVLDNDKRKSITAAIHIKPADGLRLGVSWYNDVIAKGAKDHDNEIINWRVKQNLYTGSVAYFGKKFELLAESTAATDKTDTTGKKNSFASYVYAGFKIKEKWVPYIRFDNLHFQGGEIYFHKNNTTSMVTGIRYMINYLAVLKLEYQYQHSELTGSSNKVTAQLAVGF